MMMVMLHSQDGSLHVREASRLEQLGTIDILANDNRAIGHPQRLKASSAQLKASQPSQQ